mmetsp:Transcript_1999/g.3338  ORF Transcript_1999/g.3338 Transcript_1999/m.3338 type:complete len:483 (+) Transcript_1999:192-1640(+)
MKIRTFTRKKRPLFVTLWFLIYPHCFLRPLGIKASVHGEDVTPEGQIWFSAGNDQEMFPVSLDFRKIGWIVDEYMSAARIFGTEKATPFIKVWMAVPDPSTLPTEKKKCSLCFQCGAAANPQVCQQYEPVNYFEEDSSFIQHVLVDKRTCPPAMLNLYHIEQSIKCIVQGVEQTVSSQYHSIVDTFRTLDHSLKIKVGNEIFPISSLSEIEPGALGLCNSYSNISLESDTNCFQKIKSILEIIVLEQYYSLVTTLHSNLFKTMGASQWDGVEGSILQWPNKVLDLWRHASNPDANNYVEVGFNMGHSCLLVLFANPRLNVLSFDLGLSPVVRTSARYLQNFFPGRLRLVTGDSTRTVPAFLGGFGDDSGKFDLIFVDGGHSFEVALSDITNMEGYASKLQHTLIVDDFHYPERTVQRAWNRVVHAGIVEETERKICMSVPVFFFLAAHIDEGGLVFGRINKIQYDVIVKGQYRQYQQQVPVM